MMFSALLVALLLKLSLGQLYIGDVCTIKSTGLQGTCALLKNCPPVLEDIKRRIYPTTCGFEGTLPIVCCPSSGTTTTRATTTTTTTRPTTASTPRPTPPIITSRLPGEIARRKCIEYEQYRYRKLSAPTLSFGDDEEIIKDECGQVVSTLVIGGKKASKREFPHMVALGFESDNTISWPCGGSLISDQYVLTAGHCLRDKQLGDVKLVKTGVTNLKETDTVQIIRVQERIKHPNYFLSQQYDDIGLLKLEQKVKLNPNARPACLYTKHELPRGSAVATGWGRTDFAGDSSDDLLKVTLQFFTNQDCNEFHKDERKLKRGVLDESQICAGSRLESKDTCQGDSGGPLQIYHYGDKNVTCMYDIIGITSTGKPCGLFIPGIYTRVSHYIKWIEDIVWPN